MVFTSLDMFDSGTLHPFNQHLDCSVRQFEHLQYRRQASDFINIISTRIIFCRGFLGCEHNGFFGFHCRFKRMYGLVPSHKQRDDHMRKNHDIPERKQWKSRRLFIC